MRLYGKRFFANRMDSRISDRKESRDALVYDIDEANRWCRVRVAGSDVLVRAWFPTNFMRAPNWLKINTAVRVAHVGGDKSRIEVVGPGLVQPTYATAPQSGGVDTILLGMYPTAPVEGTDWNVNINSGTYRINGVTYSFDADGMVLGSGVELGTDVTLGEDAVFVVDPIGDHPVGELWFRYDGFVIGADGVVDYLKGTEVKWSSGSTGPVKPSVPSGHVLIRNYILVWTGLTAISQKNIGMEFTAPYPERIEVTYGWPTPLGTPTDKYAQMEGGVGVIWGGPDVYEGTPKGGANPSFDMVASANLIVMNQYDLPHSYWTGGSLNVMAVSFLGIASHGGYGTAELFGIPPPEVPPIVDDSGYGEEILVGMYLGYSCPISYTRKHTVYQQPDPEQDGYSFYAQADADSHTATIRARLISSEAKHPVTVILTFWNLDSSGHPM